MKGRFSNPCRIHRTGVPARAQWEVPTIAGRRRKPRARVGPRADRLAGLVDGLRGLPNRTSGMATARQQRIAHWSTTKGQALMNYYGPLLSHLRARRERLQAYAQSQAGLLEDRRAVAERIRREGPGSGRRFGESALTDDQILRRRVSEFERTLGEALAGVRRQQEMVGSVRAAVCADEVRLSAIEEELRGDLKRVDALAGRRRANYLAGLTATHPDRDALVAGFGAYPAIGPGEEDIRAIHLVKAEESA